MRDSRPDSLIFLEEAEEADDRDEVLALLALVTTANLTITGLVEGWAAGQGVWSQAGERIVAEIVAGYAAAHRLGRSLAGDAEEKDDEDDAAAVLFWFGTAAAAGEVRYWEGLTADVQAGRYGTPESESDPANAAALADRCRSYTRRFRALGYIGWASAFDEGTLFDWILGDPVTTHCPQCPEWAAAGPYTFDTLPAIPGDGTSICQSNCLCRLAVSGGEAIGF